MSDHYRRNLVRWRLAREVLAWMVPASIVTAALVVLGWYTWMELTR